MNKIMDVLLQPTASFDSSHLAQDIQDDTRTQTTNLQSQITLVINSISDRGLRVTVERILGDLVFMAPGQTNTFVVFTVGIPVGTPVGSYPGTFSILGGSSPAAFFSLSTASFQVNVSVPAGVPEPATMLLLSSGLVGVAAKVRKRRKAV